MLPIYTQLITSSMEIEKQVALDNNNLASFRKKWALFKHHPSEKSFSWNAIKERVDTGRQT